MLGFEDLGGERLFCLNFKSIKIIILNSYAMLVILQGIIFLLGLTKVISIQDNCILEPSYQSLIDKSLAKFQQGITKEMINRGKEISQTYDFICTVEIANHSLVDHCLIPFYRKLFEKMAEQLPDMIIFFNKDDRPMLHKNKCEEGQHWSTCTCDNDIVPYHSMFDIKAGTDSIKLPMLSTCTIPECFHDIVYPTINLFIDPDIILTPWENKVFKAFWRGSNTGGDCLRNIEECLGQHRMKLVSLCSLLKDCDAEFTRISNCQPPLCQDLKEIFGTSKAVNINEQGKYKILLDIDGNSFSERTTRLMLTGSTVFKIFDFKDFVTEQIRPWEHYIPVRMDLEDLEEKLQWAKEHDEQLKLIGERGRKRALELHNSTSLQCYLYQLLKRYSKLYHLAPNDSLSSSTENDFKLAVDAPIHQP